MDIHRTLQAQLPLHIWLNCSAYLMLSTDLQTFSHQASSYHASIIIHATRRRVLLRRSENRYRLRLTPSIEPNRLVGPLETVLSIRLQLVGQFDQTLAHFLHGHIHECLRDLQVSVLANRSLASHTRPNTKIDWHRPVLEQVENLHVTIRLRVLPPGREIGLLEVGRAVEDEEDVVGSMGSGFTTTACSAQVGPVLGSLEFWSVVALPLRNWDLRVPLPLHFRYVATPTSPVSFSMQVRCSTWTTHASGYGSPVSFCRP